MSDSLPRQTIEGTYANYTVTGNDRHPVKGQKVRVRRGAIVHRYGPDWPIKREPSKRAQTVQVFQVLGPYGHAPDEPARVEWLGRGGYSRTASVEDVEVCR